MHFTSWSPVFSICALFCLTYDLSTAPTLRFNKRSLHSWGLHSVSVARNRWMLMMMMMMWWRLKVGWCSCQSCLCFKCSTYVQFHCFQNTWDFGLGAPIIAHSTGEYPAGTVTPSDKVRGKGHGVRRVNTTESDFSTPWQDAQTPMTYRRESGEEVGEGGDDVGVGGDTIDKSYVNPFAEVGDDGAEEIANTTVVDTPRKPVPKASPTPVIPTVAKGGHEKDSLYWKLPSPNGSLDIILFNFCPFTRVLMVLMFLSCWGFEGIAWSRRASAPRLLWICGKQRMAVPWPLLKPFSPA